MPFAMNPSNQVNPGPPDRRGAHRGRRSATMGSTGSSSTSAPATTTFTASVAFPAIRRRGAGTRALWLGCTPNTKAGRQRPYPVLTFVAGYVAAARSWSSPMRLFAGAEETLALALPLPVPAGAKQVQAGPLCGPRLPGLTSRLPRISDRVGRAGIGRSGRLRGRWTWRAVATGGPARDVPIVLRGSLGGDASRLAPG